MGVLYLMSLRMDVHVDVPERESFLPSSIIMSYALDGPVANNGTILPLCSQIPVEFCLWGPEGYTSEYLECICPSETIWFNKRYTLTWRGCWVSGRFIKVLHLQSGTGVWGGFSIDETSSSKVLPVLFAFVNREHEQHIFSLHYKAVVAVNPRLDNEISGFIWQFGMYCISEDPKRSQLCLIDRSIHYDSPQLYICTPTLASSRCWP